MTTNHRYTAQFVTITENNTYHKEETITNGEIFFNLYGWDTVDEVISWYEQFPYDEKLEFRDFIIIDNWTQTETLVSKGDYDQEELLATEELYGYDYFT